MSSQRIVTVDIWITLLIILVIIGHCMFPFSPDWFHKLHSWIYSFHMGAFFFICGFLISLTYHPIHSLKDYLKYIGRKFLKFGIPFLMFGILLTVLYIKKNGGGIEDCKNDMLKLFIAPTASRVIYLWFIYVLFFYYLIAPLICQYYNKTIILFLIAGVLLYLHPLPIWLAGHLFSKYLLFFIFGIIINKHSSLFSHIPERYLYLCLAGFIYISFFQSDVPYCISGILALPGLLLICRKIKRISSSQKLLWFEKISRNCFYIYLFQMVFLHLLAISYPVSNHYNTVCFIIFMIIGVILSIAGSVSIAVLLKKIFPKEII